MMIERSHQGDGLAPRVIDALIVVALFAGKALLALWIIQPSLL